jgi:cellulose synthase/poly-beta-1,6-N-acetylglucosamine synthase-like glycosyltransferase
MDIFIFIISTIVFLYSISILFLIYGFYKVPEETYRIESPINNLSIVIPFRNEEDNLEDLIESIDKIEYPISKFEVIFVNDNSEDRSYEIAEKVLGFANFNYKLISQDPEIQGKKAAITLGIENSSHPWILTTDADCVVQPLWLKLYDQKINDEDLVLIAGPINFFSNDKGFINAFQKLDLSALIGSSIGGFGLKIPFMCSGANLLFSKDAFKEVSGYDGNMHIASGDDMFLMEKMSKKYPGKLGYLKSNMASIYTSSLDNIKLFLNQRLRWSAKASKYGAGSMKFMGIMVGVANLALIAMFVLIFLGISVLQILPMIILKLSVNFWLIKTSSIFLNDNKRLYYYPIVSIIYPFYILIVSILSQFRTFEWKGRVHLK